MSAVAKSFEGKWKLEGKVENGEAFLKKVGKLVENHNKYLLETVKHSVNVAES